MIHDEVKILFRIRIGLAFFILGLVLSGTTAIPLETELDWLVNLTGAREALASAVPPVWAQWACKVQDAFRDTSARYPFIGYGGDWLAFGHFVIAFLFVGAWRDPVRNRWLFDGGLIACAAVIPWALCFGAWRGIPLWWRLIDCSFGVLGAVPLWLCRSWARRLATDVENRRG